MLALPSADDLHVLLLPRVHYAVHPIKRRHSIEKSHFNNQLKPRHEPIVRRRRFTVKTTHAIPRAH